MIRLFLILSFFWAACVASAQVHKNIVIKNFDSITYYADSTIHQVYRMKRGKFHGYSVEFNATGDPAVISYYKRGKKRTSDRQSNGWYIYNGMVAIPGCGTGKMLARREFKRIYFALLGLSVPKNVSAKGPNSRFL